MIRIAEPRSRLTHHDLTLLTLASRNLGVPDPEFRDPSISRSMKLNKLAMALKTSLHLMQDACVRRSPVAQDMLLTQGSTALSTIEFAIDDAA